ncbi:MAG: DUF6918 family protein [Myxococcota bacterium]
MGELESVLTEESKRSQVVDDTLQLVDEEVASKKGFSGMALKTGYKAVKGVKPGFLRNVVDHLLPEFARALEPVYEEAKASGSSVREHFAANAGRVADALLGITDAKARKSTNNLVKGTYDKLRGTAKTHVEAAVPRLAALIGKYV